MDTHVFEASAVWEGDSDSRGTLSSPGGLNCSFAVPPEFKGPGGCASPEELMLGALISCYIIAVAYVCEIKKLPLIKQEMHVEGEVGRDPQTRRTRFTQIYIEDRLHVDPAASDEQKEAIRQATYDAKTRCFISNSLREDIEFHIEPEIVDG